MLKLIKQGIFANNGSFRPRVLVVEDDPSLAEVLESLFETSGIDFKIYSDVDDIKSLVADVQPDIVLLDYLLPSTNGGNLCQLLKADQATSSVPVIIYSAISKTLLPIEEYRCDYFIEKPFDLDHLIQKINHFSYKNHRVN